MIKRTLSLFIFPVLLLLVVQDALAQKQADNWYFGANAGLSFTSGSPVALLNGQLSTNEGCATLSDSSGILLFYTDGIRVYTKSHTIMANGTGLTGDPSSTHSAIIIPMPCNDSLFYIFTVDNEAGPNGIRYSLVNILPNGGDGVVTIKNQPLLAPASEKLTAVSHCNGTDVWMVAHGWNNNHFYAWRISCDSIESPVVSAVGMKHPIDTLNTLHSIGQMKISPRGDKLAMVIYTGPDTAKTTIQLFDFDNFTGMVSNPLTLPGHGPMYGLEFSPDGSKLYVSSTTSSFVSNSSNKIFQFDLSSNDTNSIKLSGMEIFSSSQDDYPGQIQIGPDGKLYVARFGVTQIDKIYKPNLKGLACNYSYASVDLGGKESRFGLPPFNQKYLIDPAVETFSYSNPCDSFVISFKAPLTSKYNFWLWDFGDPASGTSDTSTAENPGHIFSDTGDYLVQLIATGVCRTDTFARTLSIDTVPYIDAGSDIFICFGNSITLGGLPSGPANGKYLWEPQTYLDHDTLANPTGTPNESISYTLTVKESAECTAYDTIHITVGPYIDAGPDGSICESGDSVILGGTPAGDSSFTFSWFPPTGINNTALPNPKAFPDTSTNYILTVTDTAGCVKTDTASILVFDSTAQAGFTFSGNCSSFQFFDNTSSGGFDSWLWDFGDTTLSGFFGGNTSTDFEPIGGHFYFFNGVYTVTLIGYTEGTCLRDTFQQDIFVGSFAINIEPEDTTVCNGDTILLSIIDTSSVQPVTYLWSPGININNDTLNNPLIYPVDTINYTVTVTRGGCSKKDSVHIEIGGYADAGHDTFICKNSNVIIGGNPSATAGSVFQWAPSIYLDDDTSANPVFSADSIGSYTYKLITLDSWGCSDSDEIFVYVKDLPLADAGADTSICNGEILFTGNNIAVNSNSYLWSPASGLSDSSQSNPQIILDVDSITVIYYVLTVTDTNGCTSWDTVAIIINPAPEVSVSVEGDDSLLTVVNLGKTFNGIVSGATGFSWTPSIYLSDTSLVSPAFYPTDTGIITYILSVISDSGCGASDTLFVEILRETILVVPDIFSPNGDGKNDVLYAYEVGFTELESFTIIDRWGNIVFETDDIHKGWDGTYKGKLSPIGVYLAELKGFDVLDEKKHIVNHKITLIR